MNEVREAGMFRGESSIAIDAKGRLGIPARYRERLRSRCGGQLVLTIGLSRDLERHRFLAAYPVPYWEERERELDGLPTLGEGMQVFKLLTSFAQECELDAQGRILVPPSLRKYAGLDKRVTFIGQSHKFELWDEASWEKRRGELFELVGKMLSDPPEDLRNLVL